MVLLFLFGSRSFRRSLTDIHFRICTARRRSACMSQLAPVGGAFSCHRDTVSVNEAFPRDEAFSCDEAFPYDGLRNGASAGMSFILSPGVLSAFIDTQKKAAAPHRRRGCPFRPSLKWETTLMESTHSSSGMKTMPFSSMEAMRARDSTRMPMSRTSFPPF